MDETTIDMYQEVLSGAHMGIDAMDELLKLAEDGKFREEMIRAQEDYKHIAARASKEIHQLGGTPVELPAMIRMSTWGMVKMECALDPSPHHMAKMILKGMDMADEKIHKKAKKYDGRDPKAAALADEMLELQNRQRSVFRKYIDRED